MWKGKSSYDYTDELKREASKYTHLSYPPVQSDWNQSSAVAYVAMCAVEPVAAHPGTQDHPSVLN